MNISRFTDKLLVFMLNKTQCLKFYNNISIYGNNSQHQINTKSLKNQFRTAQRYPS